MAANRRLPPVGPADILPPLPTSSGPAVSKKSEPHCFKLISDAIKQHDQPLVQIEDDENGAAVRCCTHTRPPPLESL